MRARLLVLAMLAAAGPLAAQDTTTARAAAITYLTSSTAYLGAGREEGLATGATLEVRRAGQVIGVLTVSDLSTHRAAAAITRADQPLAVGDSAWYRPAAVTAPEQLAQAAVRPRATRKGPSPVRGRVGVRYLYSRGSDGARTLSQPALDLRLDGADLGRTGLGVSVDVRARWSNTGGSGVVATNDGLARVYQAALLYEPLRGPVRAVIGRQMSPTLATVSFLDGALVETRGRTWSVGVVGGVEPDPETFAVSGDVKDVGGYAQLRSAPGGVRRWNVTLGGMGSYTQGVANREFAYLQGAYMDQRFSAFFAQEVDYYRPWKVAAGEERSLSPTSTYANVRWRVASPVTLAAGYDNRRNVRLFRDAVNPETQFDDAFRQGYWGSIGVSPSRRLSLGFEGRTGRGGTAGTADALSLTVGSSGWGRLGVGVRARGTRYTNPSTEGWLGSLALSASPGGRVSLELNGGIRRETNPSDDPATRQLTWVGGYADLALMRAMYLMLSATHESGDLEGSDQGYVGISWRF